MNSVNRSIKGQLILLVVAIIWGVAFVEQAAGNAVGPFTFSCTRYILASIVMVPLIRFFDGKREDKSFTRPDKRTAFLGGVICGTTLAGISILQQLGLFLGTPAGKAGFLTTTYIFMVPIAGLFLKNKCPWNVWAAVVIALAGLYLLCIKGDFTIQLSDVIILLCAVSCTCRIYAINAYGKKIDAPRLSLYQFITAACIAAVPMTITEILPDPSGWVSAFSSWSAWHPILYAGILSSCVAYTLQVVGQRYVNPTISSLIMSLESVFALLAGWIVMGDRLSVKELIGCAVIFAAVVLAQIPEKKER